MEVKSMKPEKSVPFAKNTPTPLRTHYVHRQFATVNGAGQFETDVLFLIIAQQQFADEACLKDLMKQ